MKALSMTIAMALTILASTSFADGFCLVKYRKDLGINSNQGNFYTQVAKAGSSYQQNNNSNSENVNKRN